MHMEVQPCEEVKESRGGDDCYKLSSLEPSPKYQDELSQLYKLMELGKQDVAQQALSKCLQQSHFRSVIWRVLLGIFPTETEVWILTLRELRNHYRRRRDIHIVNPHSAKGDDHPLSRSDTSVWHQYFCDKELRAVVEKDVLRTFPSEKFFRSESIQNMMINILFCYAREHPRLCYRQGMHEILAPLLFVLHADQQALLEACKVEPIEDPMLEILDHTCLEEDGYCLFSNIMKHQACTYQIHDLSPSSTGCFPYQIEQVPEMESEVFVRLRNIRDGLLEQEDTELRKHLLKLDIPLVFGMRWLRILFGQEFPMADLLLVWDAIFAADERFGLINHVVVAMMVEIRDRLLEEDFSGCLDLLMHYPTDIEASAIICRALHMQNPEEHPPPPPSAAHLHKTVPGTPSLTFAKRLRHLVKRPRKVQMSPSANKTVKGGSFRFYSISPKPKKTESMSEQMAEAHTPCYHSQEASLEVLARRIESCYKILSKNISSDAPSAVRNAIEDLKEIADKLADEDSADEDVETAVEARQSPGTPAQNLLPPNFSSATRNRSPDGDNQPESSESPGSSRVYPAGASIELTVFNSSAQASPTQASPSVDYVDPLRAQYTAENPPQRGVSHWKYRRELGGKPIFSRMTPS